MLSVTLPAAAAVLVVVGAAFFLLLRRIISPERVPSFDEDWLNEFSVARYRPMERLLSDDDYEFLESQPGYTPRIGRKLRTERRAIFRDYLRCLTRDFERLYGAIQLLMLASAQDRPDLAEALLKQKWIFAYGILAMHFRLLLHSLGKGPVEIQALVSSLDAMRLQLQQLSRVEVCASAR